MIPFMDGVDIFILIAGCIASVAATTKPYWYKKKDHDKPNKKI